MSAVVSWLTSRSLAGEQVLDGGLRVRSHRALIGSIALACSLVVAVAAFAQQREAERRIHRHAEVGETVRLGGHVNYHLCSFVIPTTITVVQSPSHGMLSTRDEVVKSAEPELGRGDKCRGSSGEGKAVYYTRTSRGVDKFEYDSLSDNGVVHVDVTVD
jgi:hypothetical protein